MDLVLRRITLCAAVLGFAGVALGALGAHALKPALAERSMVESWNIAVTYHLVHSATLLALGLARGGALPRPGLIAACWAAGVVLFSGSIYGLALGAPRALGPVTPLGGLALLAGWLLVLIQAARRNPA